MYIQVLTVKDEPLIEVANDATVASIDDAIKERFGVQSNANTHNWIGDPSDEICKPFDEQSGEWAKLFVDNREIVKATITTDMLEETLEHT